MYIWYKVVCNIIEDLKNLIFQAYLFFEIDNRKYFIDNHKILQKNDLDHSFC